MKEVDRYLKFKMLEIASSKSMLEKEMAGTNRKLHWSGVSHEKINTNNILNQANEVSTNEGIKEQEDSKHETNNSMKEQEVPKNENWWQKNKARKNFRWFHVAPVEIDTPGMNTQTDETSTNEGLNDQVSSNIEIRRRFADRRRFYDPSVPTIYLENILAGLEEVSYWTRFTNLIHF